jgi:hypothetical protein|nr:MAG TPA: hypothetical protein [Caudoviricetes sp.]
MSDTASDKDIGRQLDVLQRIVASYRERLAKVEEELVTASANLRIAQEQIGALSEKEEAGE